MSSIFEAVRSQVPVRAAAERYGLEVNDSSMARCPFHNDRTPSMKLYADHFYCFGCGKYGDVVDLTSELLCVPSYDAACALAEEFGVDAVSTTLSGYTSYSPQLEEPDYALAARLSADLLVPVFGEGRIHTPEDLKRMMELGVWSAIVGSAITRPQLITKDFARVL